MCGSVIFDFDLTLVPNESSLEIIKLALSQETSQLEPLRLMEIVERNSTSSLNLEDRLYILKALQKIERKHIEQYFIDNLDNQMSELFNKITNLGVEIFILSKGFSECIIHFARRWGIKQDNIIANRLLWWRDTAVMFSPSRWFFSKRKDFVVQKLKASGLLVHPIIVVGDGRYDHEIYLSGHADAFIHATYYVNNMSIEYSEKVIAAHQIGDLLTIIRHLLASDED